MAWAGPPPSDAHGERAITWRWWAWPWRGGRSARARGRAGVGVPGRDGTGGEGSVGGGVAHLLAPKVGSGLAYEEPPSSSLFLSRFANGNQ